jgi:general stress protein YciG
MSDLLDLEQHQTTIQTDVDQRKNEKPKMTREEAGRKGGITVSQDRAHMAAIGRKGGESVSQNREHMSSIGHKGGVAVSRDRAHMGSIGRKGGERRS